MGSVIKILIMENLGIENFWNDMSKEYPLAVVRFKTWIDAYKKIVKWEELFGNKIKFHDLPYEMQMGIMNRFFIESFAGQEEYNLVERSGAYRGEMEYALSQLNKKLNGEDY